MNLLDSSSSFVLKLYFVSFLVGQHTNLTESKSVVTTASSAISTSENPTPSNNSMRNESEIIDANTKLPTVNTEVKSIVEVEGNFTQTNSTSANYIAELYKTQVFDSPEDIKTQQEWGGNCTLAHWDQCKVLAKYFGKYEDPKDGEIKEYLIDCKEEPVVCLKNSWTVTRCNLLCMSKCNKEIQFKYDKYVSHSGECQAHAHG